MKKISKCKTKDYKGLTNEIQYKINKQTNQVNLHYKKIVQQQQIFAIKYPAFIKKLFHSTHARIDSNQLRNYNRKQKQK